MLHAATQRFLAVLREGGVIGEPSDEWQVHELEQHLHVQFPAAYKAFLLLAGNGFPPFEGSHYALEDDLPELQRAGERIALRDGHNLPSGAFVFFAHQRVAARFFFLNDGDDPAVFEYVERCSASKQLASCFSEFVLGEVRAARN